MMDSQRKSRDERIRKTLEAMGASEDRIEAAIAKDRELGSVDKDVFRQMMELEKRGSLAELEAVFVQHNIPESVRKRILALYDLRQQLQSQPPKRRRVCIKLLDSPPAPTEEEVAKTKRIP